MPLRGEDETILLGWIFVNIVMKVDKMMNSQETEHPKIYLDCCRLKHPSVMVYIICSGVDVMIRSITVLYRISVKSTLIYSMWVYIDMVLFANDAEMH